MTTVRRADLQVRQHAGPEGPAYVRKALRLLQLWVVAVVAAGAAFVATNRAQVGRGGAEWLTALGDAQRTSWIRADGKISIETMSRPGPDKFERQWTSKLDNQPRGANGLGQGVTANGVTLFVPMSIVTGSSNNVYGIDNDTGYVVWKRHFDAAMPAATAACPGGITGAATRLVSLVPPQPPAPRAGGAGGRGAVGYRSLLGEPGEGVPVESRAGGPGRAATAPAPAAARGPAPPPPPAGPINPASGRAMADEFTIPGAPPGAVGSAYWKASGVAYAISSDGQLHVMGLPSGKDIQKPAPFLPANARFSNAIAVGTMLYAATAGNCGGAPNGVWAIDLASESKPVTSWKTNGGSVIGSVAFTSDGTLIASVGPGRTTGDGKANAVVALDAKTLQLKDWVTLSGAALVTGPAIVRHNGKDIVAVAARDGRVFLLDASSLGGATHATPLHASTFAGPIGADALATWQDAGGTSWILAPAATTVLALKLVTSVGTLALERGWTSPSIPAPATPLIVNGVVFALSTDRAVLYAFDGAGTPLWNSGQVMQGPASPGSFWSAMGQVYVGTRDGTLHAFGFLDERR